MRNVSNTQSSEKFHGSVDLKIKFYNFLRKGYGKEKESVSN